MEPLEPQVREALKQAYPGLTDQDIDRTEELLVQRMQLDPQQEPERIAALDRERLDLIQSKMPKYAEVVRVARANLPRGTEKPTPNVKIEPKKP